MHLSDIYLIHLPIYQYQLVFKNISFQQILKVASHLTINSAANQYYYNKMSISQIREQSSNQFRQSCEFFNDKRIREKQEEKFYEQQTRKQFSEQFSQAVSEKMNSQDLESNQKAFGCLLQKAHSTLSSFVQKMTDVKNDFQKLSTRFIKNGNSNERQRKQIQIKNMSWSSQKLNAEEIEQIEKASKFSFKPRKIKFTKQKRQSSSQQQKLYENEEEQQSEQQPRNIFGNKQGVVVSNFSSTITLREPASKSQHKIQQQSRQSMEQSQLLQQEIKMHINLDFCGKLPEHKKGVENKRYHGYHEQYTERKRSNVGEIQKHLPKSLKCIQQSTMKRQISIIDKLDINPQFAHSEKLNYAQRKIQSLFPQSQSIDLGRMSANQSKRLRNSKEIVQVLVCSIENQMIIGKLHGIDFYIYFSSIERLVAQNKRITIFVQPIGDIFVRFSKKELPNKFMKALGSYLLDGGN